MNRKCGDLAWVSSFGMREVKKTCPVCDGKLQVELRLGNGDTVTMDCRYCAPGYESPRGYVEEREYISNPELVMITGVEISQKGEIETVEYHSMAGRYHDSVDVYDTEAEAMDACEREAERKKSEEATRVEYLKEDCQKSYSWNAGYHIREAKKHQEKAEYHRGKAVICKARAKEDKK